MLKNHVLSSALLLKNKSNEAQQKEEAFCLVSYGMGEVRLVAVLLSLKRCTLSTRRWHSYYVARMKSLDTF